MWKRNQNNIPVTDIRRKQIPEILTTDTTPNEKLHYSGIMDIDVVTGWIEAPQTFSFVNRYGWIARLGRRPENQDETVSHQNGQARICLWLVIPLITPRGVRRTKACDILPLSKGKDRLLFNKTSDLLLAALKESCRIICRRESGKTVYLSERKRNLTDSGKEKINWYCAASRLGTV